MGMGKGIGDGGWKKEGTGKGPLMGGDRAHCAILLKYLFPNIF